MRGSRDRAVVVKAGTEDVQTNGEEPKIVNLLTTWIALGVGRHLRVLGVMELAFATLFVIPAT